MCLESPSPVLMDSEFWLFLIFSLSNFNYHTWPSTLCGWAIVTIWMNNILLIIFRLSQQTLSQPNDKETKILKKIASSLLQKGKIHCSVCTALSFLLNFNSSQFLFLDFFKFVFFCHTCRSALLQECNIFMSTNEHVTSKTSESLESCEDF